MSARTASSVSAPSRGTNVRLWLAQSVLGALFLFAGVFKLVTPAEQLAAQSHMSGAFIQFIGVCETLGALGMLLPGIFRTHRELTPIAALGLVIIMIGAVTITVAQGPAAGASVPFITCVLALYVARGRRSWIPRATISSGRRLQVAR